MARISPRLRVRHGRARRLGAAPHRDGDRHGQVLRSRLRQHEARPARAGGGPLDDRADQRLRRLPGHACQGRRTSTTSTRASTPTSPRGPPPTPSRSARSSPPSSRSASPSTTRPWTTSSGQRLHAAFADDEVADLIICCGMFLGLGRAMAVVGVSRRTSASSSEPRQRPGGPMASTRPDHPRWDGARRHRRPRPHRRRRRHGRHRHRGRAGGRHRHPGARRRRPARHAGPRRHPRALRRPGHVGRRA